MGQERMEVRQACRIMISLWSVILLQWGQNFLISSRSVVFRRFFSDV